MATTLGLTPKYFPFPHPTSATIAPSGKDFKNASTLGHAYKTFLIIFNY